MAVDFDEPIKRDHTANVKNHKIRRLAPTSVLFNGIPCTCKIIAFRENPGYRVLVIGYSLGAGVSQLVTLALEKVH